MLLAVTILYLIIYIRENKRSHYITMTIAMI